MAQQRHLFLMLDSVLVKSMTQQNRNGSGPLLALETRGAGFLGRVRTHAHLGCGRHRVRLGFLPLASASRASFPSEFSD